MKHIVGRTIKPATKPEWLYIHFVGETSGFPHDTTIGPFVNVVMHPDGHVWANPPRGDGCGHKVAQVDCRGSITYQLLSGLGPHFIYHFISINGKP